MHSVWRQSFQTDAGWKSNRNSFNLVMIWFDMISTTTESLMGGKEDSWVLPCPRCPEVEVRLRFLTVKYFSADATHIKIFSIFCILFIFVRSWYVLIQADQMPSLESPSCQQIPMCRSSDWFLTNHGLLHGNDDCFACHFQIVFYKCALDVNRLKTRSISTTFSGELSPHISSIV